MSDTFQFSLNAIRFEDIRAEIVKFLTEQGSYSSPLDFEGSNLAYIIDTMAYTTMLMSYMVSTVANDNFLDTTTLRKNAVSISKTLGYKPKRIQASRIEGVFTYNPGDTIFSEESRLIIPANSVFPGSEDGYTWTNTEPILLYRNPKNPFELTSLANEQSPRVALIQGVFKKYSVLGDGKNLQAFVIPSIKIDENNMKVSIYTTQEDEATRVQWTHAKTFFDIKTNEIYFVEEDIVQEGCPKIIFGNGIVGRAPSLTETIVVEYLETLGPEANGEIDLDIPANVVINKSFDIDFVDVQNLSFEPSGPSFGGLNFETLDKIKANAPRFFAAAGRAVTKNDYTTLLLNEYGHMIDSAAVIGGDTLVPGNRSFLGDTYISCTPLGSITAEDFSENLQLYLTEATETVILSELGDSGIVATKKYFLKPTYIYIDILPKIEVNANISPTDLKETEEKAYNTLVEYFETEFKGFQQPFRNSKVRSQVDAIDTVIATDIDIDYNFVLNRDSFYIDKDTVNWLPVKYLIENGVVQRNENQIPKTTNFVKKNAQIIEDYNANNQSIIELFRINVSDEDEVTFDFVTKIWHNRDPAEDLYDNYWEIGINETPRDGNNVLQQWDITINYDRNGTRLAIGEIKFYENKTFSFDDFELINGIDVKAFLRNIVEVNTEFDIIDADPLNGINYISVRIRRKFNKYNLLPELIENAIAGRTSVHGALTHDNLSRFLFNNDVYSTDVIDLFVLQNNEGNPFLIQETNSFNGQGANQYTVSLTRESENFLVEGNIVEYNIHFNNITTEDRKKVATMIWDKSKEGIEQFEFFTLEEEATWLAGQGFEVKQISGDGRYSALKIFDVSIDVYDKYRVQVTMNSSISSIRVNEKNLIGAFTFDESAQDNKFSFYPVYTRTFRNRFGVDIPLVFSENDDAVVHCSWNDEYSLFSMFQYDGQFNYGIVEPDSFVSLELRKEVYFEPLVFKHFDEEGKEYDIQGFGIFCYGIYHDTTIGQFEYESGKMTFNRIIEGKTNGRNNSLELVQTHIRDYFNNYGILEKDKKMDVINIIPDNDYEIVDSYKTRVGSLTDFDSVHTQVVRANINPVISTQI